MPAHEDNGHHAGYIQGHSDGYEAGKRDGISMAAMSISRFFRRAARPVAHPVEPTYTATCPTCKKPMTAPEYVFRALKHSHDRAHRADMRAAIGAAIHNHPHDFGAESTRSNHEHNTTATP